MKDREREWKALADSGSGRYVCPYCKAWFSSDYYRKRNGGPNPLGTASARNNFKSHLAACGGKSPSERRAFYKRWVAKNVFEARVAEYAEAMMEDTEAMEAAARRVKGAKEKTGGVRS